MLNFIELRLKVQHFQQFNYSGELYVAGTDKKMKIKDLEIFIKLL